MLTLFSYILFIIGVLTSASVPFIGLSKLKLI
nr:cytochrome b6/f complex subunit VI [Fossombronia foveolata]WIA67231.1 cytochrome b6/f complex subunit VI [Fossombronia foveolata]